MEAQTVCLHVVLAETKENAAACFGAIQSLCFFACMKYNISSNKPHRNPGLRVFYGFIFIISAVLCPILPVNLDFTQLEQITVVTS